MHSKSIEFKISNIFILIVSIVIIANSFINVFAISSKQINSDISYSYSSISDVNYGMWDIVVSEIANKQPSEFIKQRLFYNNLSEFNNSKDVINKCLTVINIKALGQDPKNYNGKNYLEELVQLNISNDSLDSIYIMFTLAYCDYNNQKVLSTLIDNLLSYQTDDGGFTINKSGYPSEQLTGMVITALSPYSNKKNVKDSINKSINWLQLRQLEDGSFMGSSKKSGQATMWVITGLVCNKIKIDDKRFVKQNKNLYEILNIYRQDSGEYTDYVGNSGSGYITEQAILSLKAIEKGKSPFFSGTNFYKYCIAILVMINLLILGFIFYKKIKGEK